MSDRAALAKLDFEVAVAMTKAAEVMDNRAVEGVTLRKRLIGLHLWQPQTDDPLLDQYIQGLVDLDVLANAIRERIGENDGEVG